MKTLSEILKTFFCSISGVISLMLVAMNFNPSFAGSALFSITILSVTWTTLLGLGNAGCFKEGRAIHAKDVNRK